MKQHDVIPEWLFIAVQIVMAFVAIYLFGFLIIVPQIKNVSGIR